MSKHTIIIFTIVGILSFIFRLLSLLYSYYFASYTFAIITDVIGQLLFLSLFFFIAKDLKQNYSKGVRFIYLFVFSSLVITFFNITNILSRNMMLFIQLLVLAMIAVFIVYLLKTVYRLFAVAYIVTLVMIFAFQFVVRELVPNISYNYLLLLNTLPILYPLVLIYIVHTKNNVSLEEEINSIGSDVEA
ncbi:MAG: hypothetical protein QM763_00425 [Agriterribacter sp.]